MKGRAIAVLVFLAPIAGPARADIYQWEWVNPADPSQGKQKSASLCPDGGGPFIDAVPGAHLGGLDLTQAYLAYARLGEADLTHTDLSRAYLRGADVSGAGLWKATLAGADLSGANLMDAGFHEATLSGADLTDAEVRGASFLDTTSRGFTAAQLYSTASYKARDLMGISLAYNDLSGWDFAGQDLTYVLFGALSGGGSLGGTTLTGADLTDAEVRGASFFDTTSRGFTAAQLYSTASYKARDLTGIFFTENDFSGWDFAGQNLMRASFYRAALSSADLSGADTRGAERLDLADAVTTNTIRPDGSIGGLDLAGGRMLVVRDYTDWAPLDAYLNDPREEAPIELRVLGEMNMGTDGVLRIVLDEDEWDSTISFEEGIPVSRGGTLELTFAPGVDAAGQVGHTVRLFDWSGVSPTGAFGVSSPHAWDLASFYTTGEVTLVPEPATLLLLSLGGLAMIRRRRHR